MIEINLLPQELRRPEGTPLPRLLSILIGITLALVGGLFMANYYLVEIPKTDQEIKAKTRKRDNKKKEAEAVDKIDAEIHVIQAKVGALRNLKKSRILWARFLDRFSRSFPDGCAVSSFHVSPQGGGGGLGLDENSGARFLVSIRGFTSGESRQVCQQKLAQLMNNLNKNLDVNLGQDAPPAPAGAPKTKPGQLPAGYSPFLKLKFSEPRVTAMSDRKPSPVRFKGKVKPKDFVMPEAELTFTMTFSFALPPPSTEIGP